MAQRRSSGVDDTRDKKCDSYFPDTGFLRIGSILAPVGPIPVARSTWWAGVKDGRFPKPVKIGPRTTVWRVEDIRALIEDGR